MTIHEDIVESLARNRVGFVTTVPCKQLAGVIGLLEHDDRFLHVPSNKEDEGMGLCAGAFMGASGRRSSCRTPRSV